MARKPLGSWQPSTEAQDVQMTDDTNEALRAEMERGAKAMTNQISEPQKYLLDGQVLEVDPKVTKGLLDAKEAK